MDGHVRKLTGNQIKSKLILNFETSSKVVNNLNSYQSSTKIKKTIITSLTKFILFLRLMVWTFLGELRNSSSCAATLACQSLMWADVRVPKHGVQFDSPLSSHLDCYSPNTSAILIHSLTRIQLATGKYTL